MEWNARRRLEDAGGKTLDLAFAMSVSLSLARRWLREPPQQQTVQRIDAAIKRIERGYRAPFGVRYRELDGGDPCRNDRRFRY